MTGGAVLLTLLYRRTERTLAATMPPGARYSWRTILHDQFKTYAEGIDSWLCLLAIVLGAVVIFNAARARAKALQFRNPPHPLP